MRLLYYLLRFFWTQSKRIKQWGVTMVRRLQLSQKKVFFEDGSRIDSKTFMEGYNTIGRNSKLCACNVGFGSYIAGANLTNVKIGRFCSIGANLTVVSGLHPTRDFVSTHPAFFSISNKRVGFSFVDKQKFSESTDKVNGYTIQIGNDVWIGQNVTIMAGVTIGDGAIVGTNSLVTRNIEPYSINVGVPTRRLRYRFTSEQISSLLRMQWWNNDLEWVKSKADSFDDVESFLKGNMGKEPVNPQEDYPIIC